MSEPIYDAVAAQFSGPGVSQEPSIADSSVAPRLSECRASGPESALASVQYAFGLLWDAVAGLLIASQVHGGEVVDFTIPPWETLDEDEKSLFMHSSRGDMESITTVVACVAESLS